MAGERAQAAAARALASLGVDADLGGGSPALDIGLLVGGGGTGTGRERGRGSGRGGRGERGGRGKRGERGKRGGRGGRGSPPSLPTSPTYLSPSTSSPSPTRAARLSARGASSGEAPARAASRPAARGSGAGSGGAPNSAPQGQSQPTALLNGAQAEAAKKALALNLKLQAALRKELRGMEDTLQRNREVLMAAEARLSSKRCVGITTSSDKFRWSRAVQKFLQLGAHPGKNPGMHKEQEAVLRRDQVPWKPAEVEALSKYMTKNHPEELDPQTAAHELLQAADWERAAVFVDKNTRRKNKRDRVHCMRTGDECRLRWTYVDVFGAEADVAWTKEEDLAILMQAEQRGAREWVKIAEEVQKVNGGVRRRTPIACLRRFQATLNTNFVRWSKWTDGEDQTLHAAVKRYGPRNWLMVARDLPGRSPAQCENKFKHTRKTNPLVSASLLNLAQHEGRLRHGHGEGEGKGRQQPRDGDGGPRDEDLLQQQQQQQQRQQPPLPPPPSPPPPPQQQQQQQQQPHAEKSAAEQDVWASAQPTRGGLWTPTEERRLCLAVRALMPQNNNSSNNNTTNNRSSPSRPATAAAEDDGRVETGATASGTGAGKKRRRDTGASPSDGQGPPRAIPRGRGGEEEEEEEEERAGRRKRSREATNTLEYLRGVHWGEVAELMAHTRNEWQCRVKWFEVMDPSVNRSRNWGADEDARLLKILKVRRIGGWRAVERDMAEFAQGRGILRRTDHSCKRRFRKLEPEKYAQHMRDTRDRREVEPRLNAPHSADHGGKTEITFEDFDLVDDGSEEEEEEEEEDEEEEEEEDEEDDDDGW